MGSYEVSKFFCQFISIYDTLILKPKYSDMNFLNKFLEKFFLRLSEYKLRIIIVFFLILILLFQFALPYLFIVKVNWENQQKIDSHQSTFESELWKKDTESRIYMVEDFLRKYNNKKLSRDDILDLLGKPSDGSNRDTFFSYYLGQAPTGIFNPLAFLEIYFEDGYVSKFDVQYD
jgi:hypothetical protein